MFNSGSSLTRISSKNSRKYIDSAYARYHSGLNISTCLPISLSPSLFSSTPHLPQSINQLIFSARQHICYSALYAIARASVRLSVTRVDQSKTVEVRITQPSTQSSLMTLVS